MHFCPPVTTSRQASMATVNSRRGLWFGGFVWNADTQGKYDILQYKLEYTRYRLEYLERHQMLILVPTHTVYVSSRYYKYTRTNIAAYREFNPSTVASYRRNSNN